MIDFLMTILGVSTIITLIGIVWGTFGLIVYSIYRAMNEEN